MGRAYSGHTALIISILQLTPLLIIIHSEHKRRRIEHHDEWELDPVHQTAASNVMCSHGNHTCILMC